MHNFWKTIERPIKMLAPMAGYTDSAFRLLCRELGADVVMTELVSADAIAYAKLKVKSEKLKVEGKVYQYKRVEASKNQSTADLLSFFEEERPFVVQLFGKHPENFAKAARWINEELKPDGIDINMGCPARKVVGSDHGAALLKNPDLACEIVRAVKENTNLPVSVKTRLGWDNDDQILSFAPLLWHAGITAITLHGRTYKDGFKGKARWDNIYKVKEILPNLVVIGNGDITSINQKLNVKNQNECQHSVLGVPNVNQNESYHPYTPPKLGGEERAVLDGIAIGRATFGKPWIFSRECVDAEELKKIMLRHAKLAFETKGEHGIIEFRKHLLLYLKGFPGAKEFRKQATAVVNFQEINDLVSTL